jgi:AraC family transcriptional regulator, L-rhamnose operon regulatory protein RhaS
MRDVSKLSRDRISSDFKIYHVISDEKKRDLKYHFHDFHEIFIFLDGNIDIIIEGRKYDIQPGNIFLIHSQDLHRAIINKDMRYERCYIYVNPLYFESFSTMNTKLDLCFSSILNQRSSMLATSVEEVKVFVEQFGSLQNDNSYGSDIRLNNLFLDFIIFINTKLLQKNKQFELSRFTVHPLVGEVINYIQANLSDNLGVESIAKKFFVSQSHLSREFKKFTGFTIHDYVLTKRLLYAKTLLLRENKSVDIYSKCGFVSYHHFIKCFKKQFGITPKVFQSQHKFSRNQNKNLPM